MEGEKAIMRDQQEPRDTFRIAYFIHFLLGVGNLLPWNASITAVDYFGYLYPTKHVEKVFSVAYMTSSVLLLVLMIAWDGWSKKTSFRFRMNMGFSLFILSILVSPIMDWASSMTGSNWRPNEAYSVIVASIVACGLADGLVAGSLIGSAGRLPKQFMQAVFAGTASSGIIYVQTFKLTIFFLFPLNGYRVIVDTNRKCQTWSRPRKHVHSVARKGNKRSTFPIQLHE